MINTRLRDFSEHDLKVGFIGCGNIASFHAQVLQAIGVSIHSVTATTDSKHIAEFSEKFNVPNRYSDYRQMLSDSELDAIYVLAPWNVIDSMLLPLIESGIPLFVEKPVALTVSRLEEALALCEKCTCRMKVGYNRRYYDFVPAIKSLLASKEIKSIELHAPESSAGIEEDDFVNNLFLINSIHVIDLMLYLLDYPNVEIREIFRHLDAKGRCNGYNGLLFAAESIPVHLISSWNSPSNFGLKFHCDHELIELIPMENASVYEGFDILEPTDDCPIRRYLPRLKKEYRIDARSAQFKPGLLKQAIAFFDECVLPDSSKCQCSDLSTSLAVTELCLRIMGKHDE